MCFLNGKLDSAPLSGTILNIKMAALKRETETCFFVENLRRTEVPKNRLVEIFI